MAGKATNKKLRKLLHDLGFGSGEVVKNNHRVFRHPDSRCVIVLPDNRDGDAARLADVAGLKDQLSQCGHLEESAFDRFIVEDKLPTA